MDEADDPPPTQSSRGLADDLRRYGVDRDAEIRKTKCRSVANMVTAVKTGPYVPPLTALPSMPSLPEESPLPSPSPTKPTTPTTPGGSIRKFFRLRSTSSLKSGDSLETGSSSPTSPTKAVSSAKSDVRHQSKDVDASLQSVSKKLANLKTLFPSSPMRKSTIHPAFRLFDKPAEESQDLGASEVPLLPEEHVARYKSSLVKPSYVFPSEERPPANNPGLLSPTSSRLQDAVTSPSSSALPITPTKPSYPPRGYSAPSPNAPGNWTISQEVTSLVPARSESFPHLANFKFPQTSPELSSSDQVSPHTGPKVRPETDELGGHPPLSDEQSGFLLPGQRLSPNVPTTNKESLIGASMQSFPQTPGSQHRRAQAGYQARAGGLPYLFDYEYDIPARYSPDSASHYSPRLESTAGPEFAPHTCPEFTFPARPELSYHPSPEFTSPSWPEGSSNALPEFVFPARPEISSYTSPGPTFPTSPELTTRRRPEIYTSACSGSTFPASPGFYSSYSPEFTFPPRPEFYSSGYPEPTFAPRPEFYSSGSPASPYPASPGFDTRGRPEPTFPPRPEFHPSGRPEYTFPAHPGSPSRAGHPSPVNWSSAYPPPEPPRRPHRRPEALDAAAPTRTHRNTQCPPGPHRMTSPSELYAAELLDHGPSSPWEDVASPVPAPAPPAAAPAPLEIRKRLPGKLRKPRRLSAVPEGTDDRATPAAAPRKRRALFRARRASTLRVSVPGRRLSTPLPLYLIPDSDWNSWMEARGMPREEWGAYRRKRMPRRGLFKSPSIASFFR